MGYCKMEDPVVEISDGKLRGIVTKDNNGDKFYAFLGVPYGKAPQGELRFKAPLPAEPWSGILDAVKDGDPCFQMDRISNTIMGSEDCLYINVFTRNISEHQPLKPVLFYVHGGAFSMGSSNSTMYSPVFLITEDLVVVSFNYRVGVFGFLSLSDTSLDIAGNAALKDQLLALKWVQKNIRKFGGDPNNVTMAGGSAGSVSVSHHVLSPASKGLFHKAILNSGTVLCNWATDFHPNSAGILKYLGQKYTNDAELLDTLRSVTATDLLNAQKELQKKLDDTSAPPFRPTVEKPNDTAFLTKKPIDIITSGDYNHVPMLISFTSNEGLAVALVPEEDEKIHSDLYIPQIILPDDKMKREQILRELKELYHSEKYINNKYLAAGDSIFTSGVIGLTKHLARTCTQPVYLYKFDVVSSRNKLRKIMKTPDDMPGASHGDDTGYIFDSHIFKDCPIIPGSLEDITMRRCVKILANFAKYGNPSSNHEDFKNLSWVPVTKDTLHYLYFGRELSMGTNPEEDRMKVWKKVLNSHEDTKGYIP